MTPGRAVRLLCCAALLSAGCGDRARERAFPIPGDRGDRVIVEVLNASGKAGLARAATRLLRQAGIDVVSFGNATADATTGESERGAGDSTRILIRRGSLAAGERIRKALGAGRVVSAPDTTRLVDASVLLGADFRPRAELHP